MYPNQYGQQSQNNSIGFNPNLGQPQQGGVAYPGQGQGQGGLPYPVYPSQQSGSGFQQNSSPYPTQAAGVYPPQLPQGNIGYSANQPPSYPPVGYPGNPQPGGYPQSSAYNSQGGFGGVSQPPTGIYPSNSPQGAYPPTNPTSGSYTATNPYTGGYSSAYPGTGQVTASVYPQSQGQITPSVYPQSQGQITPSVYPQSQAQPAYAPRGYSPQPHGQAFGSASSQAAYPTQQFTASHAHSYGADPQGANRGFPGAQKMQVYVERPTVVQGHFDPATDAKILRKAMKGFGTDEVAILNVICKRTNVQRLQISQAYKTSFGKDLIKDLKSELGGRVEDVIVALMTPHFDYLAMTVQKAISGIGTKERLLVDVLCTSTNEEIRLISASYSRLFGRSLERELTGDTSGHFRRLLVSMTAAGRMENQPADPQMAANDAKALYDAGAHKIGTDEATFNQILCLRSFQHLRLVFYEYEKTYGRSFEKVIENEFSGDIESGMKAVVACAKNRAAYFASRLHESFAGLGTKDEELIFIMVTRCEIDMHNIKEEFQRNYNKDLGSAIASETSGDYKKALIALLGN